MLKILKIKDEKQSNNDQIIKNLESEIHLSKMKLAEIVNLAFESEATDFIEKIELLVLKLEEKTN